jgi:hypothetical protein
MSWERKPSYSSLIFDGSFQTWNDALKCVFENIINGDIDKGEISPSPRKIFIDLVPDTEGDIKCAFPGISFQKYQHEEFAELWYEDRCFHVKKITI